MKKKTIQTHRRPSHLAIILLLLGLAIIISVATIRINILHRELGKPSPQLSFFNTVRYTFAMLRQQTHLLSRLGEDPLNVPSFKFEAGQSAREICINLSEFHPDLLANECLSYLIYTGQDRILFPGTYPIHSFDRPIDVYSRLSDPSQALSFLVIYAGWRAEEIGQALEQILPISQTDFMSAVLSPSPELMAILHLQSGDTLEGYFRPGGYELQPNSDLNTVLGQITAGNQAFFTPTMQARMAATGLSQKQIFTLASIIERETKDQTEMPLIACVFFNRLHQGMLLQTDPTVQYTVGYDTDSRSWWKPVLSMADLQTNSPYNTYVVKGLPPAPIGAFSEASLEAVLSPESCNYLYFRARCDGSGSHDFSLTYEEHLSKACP